jgi:Ca2+-binding RTX toxin-like protein
MARSLKYSSIVKGVTAEEIVALALENVTQQWTDDGCTDFVWGITNLAGLPFFDLGKSGPANQPPDVNYEVPHTGAANRAGDGWFVASTSNDVSTLANMFKPGDVVRVYDYGDTSETRDTDGDGLLGHSFIVVSVAGGVIKVVDNWSLDDRIVLHNWTDITAKMAPGGKFQSAFVSRIDQDWVDDNVPNTIRGLGLGDWSGISTGPQFTSGADDVTLTQSGGTWSALGGNDTVIGTSGRDTINGGSGRDKLDGQGSNDNLRGGSDSDTLIGGSGSDTLKGESGQDSLTGGTGSDKFTFTAVSHSAASTSSADVITDFSKVDDWVDVSGIDANTAASGNQEFILDAKGTSSTAVARGHIGWYQVNNSGSSNDFTYIRLNVDSDSTIESVIKLKGLINLATTDFIL